MQCESLIAQSVERCCSRVRETGSKKQAKLGDNGRFRHVQFVSDVIQLLYVFFFFNPPFCDSVRDHQKTDGTL